MPLVELLQPPTIAPPTVGSTCVCPSSFGLDVGPSHLTRRPGGNPPGVVPPERLLVPHQSCDGDVP
jgi:hypothetical protein